jgi:hypothetical protein
MVGAELAPECIRRDAKDARRLLAAAPGLLKNAQDVPPLDLGQREQLFAFAACCRGASDLRRKVSRLNLWLAPEREQRAST